MDPLYQGISRRMTLGLPKSLLFNCFGIRGSPSPPVNLHRDVPKYPRERKERSGKIPIRAGPGQVGRLVDWMLFWGWESMLTVIDYDDLTTVLPAPCALTGAIGSWLQNVAHPGCLRLE